MCDMLGVIILHESVFLVLELSAKKLQQFFLPHRYIEICCPYTCEYDGSLHAI